MSIATRYLIFFSLLATLLVATLLAMSLQAISAERAADAEFQRYEARKLAEQLRQSSDDLTRMARSYVTTGDQKFEAYFFDILAIRNGEKPRPEGYDGVYWDFITARDAPHHLTGQKAALHDLMEQAGFTEGELISLENALEYSDALAEIETKAFSAMKGVFADENGALTVKGEPDPALARRLLFSSDYHRAKAQIMEPINTFFDMVDKRTFRNSIRHRADQVFYRNLAIGLICLTIALVLLSHRYLKKHLIGPIKSMAVLADNIIIGEPHQRAETSTNDELGRLGKAFNAMTDKADNAMMKLARLSSVDKLTQVANRRVFDETLEQEWRRCQRARLPLSLLMIDIDYFKHFNDASGHLAGDECLKQVSSILAQRRLRPGDLLARYGGEEFTFILAGTRGEDAVAFAETMCSSVENARIIHPSSSASAYVTVSIGVATLIPDDTLEPPALIEMADSALYQAKNQGRNRVVSDTPTEEMKSISR